MVKERDCSRSCPLFIPVNKTKYAEINLKTLKKSYDFFRKLTNQAGIIQHTKFGLPERKNGYSLDDNARALIVAVSWYRIFGEREALDLAEIYLAWLLHAKNDEGFFYNFSTFDNQFKEVFSEDGFGRAFWALGYLCFANARRDLTSAGKNLVSEVTFRLDKINSPRAIAYCLLGLYYLFRAEPEEPLWQNYSRELADRLVKLYERKSTPNWRWFEDILAYSNHILPLALLKACLVVPEKKYFKIGLASLDFIEDKSRIGKVPAPIGNHGWFVKGGKRAVYDQQPIEASEAILANLAAFQATDRIDYVKAAIAWLAWYHGENTKKIALLDEETGGCYDSLTEEGVNQNQGAESIVAYLMAELAIADLEKAVKKQ